MLALVPLDNLRKKLETEAMRAGKDSVDRWKRMEAIVKQEGPVGKRYIDEIMLQFSYPRLDINVRDGFISQSSLADLKSDQICARFHQA